ncbi:hypothetical protein [Neosynechococcus sphagnicola]|nr:hypothetical protein [Neosynechococcus sphagnicola]
MHQAIPVTSAIAGFIQWQDRTAPGLVRLGQGSQDGFRAILPHRP